MRVVQLCRLRSALKLSFAVALALASGFYFQLEIPRWAVVTAVIVIAGPAFVAGQEPYSGAIFHRSLLRVVGTLLGGMVGLLIMFLAARAPVVMLLLCCLWIGVCTWRSSLVRVEYAYAWALSGYTVLVLIVTVTSTPGTLSLAPEFVIERISEVMFGICCAFIAEVIFMPRSAKADIDDLVEQIFISHYQIMRSLCLSLGGNVPREQWLVLHQLHIKLESTLNLLARESSRWEKCAHRGKKLYALSLSILTCSHEVQRDLSQNKMILAESLSRQFETKIFESPGIRHQLRSLHHSLLSSKSNPLQLKILYWLGGMIRYRLLVRGIFSNCAYLPVESKLLRKTEPAIVKSAEQFSSAINGLRAFVASMTCVAIWGWTGWTSASGFMVVIAVMCSLAMRTTNPQKTGLDFVLGMLIALPLGMFYFLVVLPMTQQNLMLLLISMVLLIFVIGWEGQKKRIGAMGTLMGVLNLLVLSNPMVFNFNAFIDAALGQLIGSLIGYLVILIFPDNSQAVTRRALITCLRREVFHQLRSSVRNSSQLPQMYAYYNRLEQIEPTDVLALNLAMNLIMDYHELAHENLLRVNAGAEQDAIEVICAKKLG
ncbi:FUSC family protein [Yokenella regensburgei]|jgi:p-hydroxybenzoic acid efflux pump subunit AaeB|uniref:FUSC family protein n=1 Tax=Yokenella regensburgei TaxID=158877 RepID=UPI0027D99C2E|nr:FUSC family protein [Yokenella regensburgei]MDQ4427977.1 FUSC family protein [Yokenella regensburgei]